MTTSLADVSPSARGRALAVLYLFVIVAGVIGQAFISNRLVVGSDAAATAANILANRSLYRLAWTIFMVEMVAQLAVTALFYDLLRPVDRSLARLSAVIGWTGAGIKTFARCFHYAPLIVLSGAPYLASIPPAQLEALALVLFRINAIGTNAALVFFGFETLLRGWLLVRCGFLPRVLGVLSMIGGVGWLAYLWPPFGARVFMPVALFAIASVIVTTGWLLVRGVDDAAWRARAALAATSIWR